MLTLCVLLMYAIIANDVHGEYDNKLKPTIDFSIYDYKRPSKVWQMFLHYTFVMLYYNNFWKAHCYWYSRACVRIKYITCMLSASYGTCVFCLYSQSLSLFSVGPAYSHTQWVYMLTASTGHCQLVCFSRHLIGL